MTTETPKLKLQYSKVYDVVSEVDSADEASTPFSICLDLFEGKESLLIYLNNCDMPVVAVREPDNNKVAIYIDTDERKVDLILNESNSPDWVPE